MLNKMASAELINLVINYRENHFLNDA